MITFEIFANHARSASPSYDAADPLTHTRRIVTYMDESFIGVNVQCHSSGLVDHQSFRVLLGAPLLKSVLRACRRWSVAVRIMLFLSGMIVHLA